MNTPKAGDILTPRSLWNSSSPKSRWLPAVCTVESVATEQRCQTGTMVEVKDIHGAPIRMDLAWFEEYHKGDPTNPDAKIIFQSSVSGLWYENPEAAGDVFAIKYDGEIYEKRIDRKKEF